MKCCQCFKKKEKLYCKACSSIPSDLNSKKISYSDKIVLQKICLENKVTNILHFYFDSQELKEKQVKINHFKSHLTSLKDLTEIQAKNLFLLNLKKLEKETNIQQLQELKDKFTKLILIKNSLINEQRKKIDCLKKTLENLQYNKLKYYNNILEINSIYPKWSIYKELSLEKENEFSPIYEEDIEEALSSEASIDNIDFYEEEDNYFNKKTYKISLVKPFNHLNEIYGQIIAFSLNQLGKIVFYSSKIYGIFLPLDIHLDGDKIKIRNFCQNKRFYEMKNIFYRKNFIDSQKFLILLLMNFLFILKFFKHQQDILKQGYIDWKEFYDYFINSEGKKLPEKPKISNDFYFKLIKQKYPSQDEEQNKPKELFDESLISFKEEKKKEEKKIEVICESKSDESFEILDNLNEIDLDF